MINKFIVPAILPEAVRRTLRPLNAGESRVPFSARYIRTNGYVDGKKYPFVTLVDPRKELLDYYKVNKDVYSMEHRGKARQDAGMGFLDAADEYGDSYFEDHVLILILLEERSGAIRHAVTDVVRSGDHVEIRIKRIVPEFKTSDMAQWHIIVGIRKEDFREAEINVTIASPSAAAS